MFRFSPKKNYLAVGSEELSIDFYEVTPQGKLNRVSYCKQVPGPVLQMDWSTSGVYLKATMNKNLIDYLNNCF